MRKILAIAAVAAASALPSAGAWAQAAGAWPARPLRLVVPYPPGGNSDAIGRFVANKLSAGLGQPVVVENKAGAGATIGTEVAARAPGDGYTFLVAPTAVFAITPQLRKVPYDPVADFVPVAQVSGSYSIITARRDAPFDDVKGLVAAASREPGKLSFGSAGAATATHLSGEMVALRAGIRLLHVPYKGSAEALSDLVGGRIDLIFDPVGLPQVKSGTVKALAVLSDKRHPELPQVPTLKEQGYDVDTRSWFGVFAPKGTPPAVVDRVAAEVERMLRTPEAREVLLKFSQYPDYLGPEPFAKRIVQDTAFFGDLIKRANIRVE